VTSVPADPPPDGGPGHSGAAGRHSADRPPPPGPLAVEAALLVEALQGLAGTESGNRLWETVAEVAGGVGAAAGGGDCAGHGRPCTSCPLCRLLAMFAGDRPEVVRHLLTAAESLVAAFRVALDTYSGTARPGTARPGTARPGTARPGTAPASPGAGHTARQDPRPGAAAGTRPAPAPRPRVQRIDVT
jgi:hypothetical protein